MNILLCSISSPHEITGIGKYNGDLVDWFRGRGHQVDVLTTLPYYPYWEIYEDYRDNGYTVERFKNGTMHSVRLPVDKNVSSLRRVMMDSTLGLKTLFRLPYLSVKNKYDIVLLILPPITTFPAAILGKLAGRAKLHVHVQDLQLEAARELELLPSPLLGALESYEKLCLKSADYISSISKNMVVRLEDKITNSSIKTGVVENWADIDAIHPIDEKGWLKKRFDYPEDTFLMVYSGNIGEKQGIDQILPVAKYLEKYEDIQFLVLGDGASKVQLAEARAAMGLSNIRLGNLVPREDLNLMLNGSDAQIVLQRKSAGDSFLPSKYMNILSAGAPSVVTAKKGTELHGIAEQNKTSLVAEPEHTEQISEAILRLYRDSELRKCLAVNAREFALANYSQDAILGELEGFYEKLIGSR